MKFAKNWGRLGMKYDLQRLYDYFYKLQSNKDYFQYFNDIEVNDSIINQNPFVPFIAEKQIKIMVGKYGDELNKLADFYANGRTTTSSNVSKNTFQVREDLIYITNNIPIMALMRELPKEVFNNMIEIYKK